MASLLVMPPVVDPSPAAVEDVLQINASGIERSCVYVWVAGPGAKRRWLHVGQGCTTKMKQKQLTAGASWDVAAGTLRGLRRATRRRAVVVVCKMPVLVLLLLPHVHLTAWGRAQARSSTAALTLLYACTSPPFARLESASSISRQAQSRRACCRPCSPDLLPFSSLLQAIVCGSLA